MREADGAAGPAARARGRSCARSRRRPSCCATDFDVAAEVWSVTSFTELRRDGLALRSRGSAAARTRSRDALGRRVPRRQRGPGGRGDRLHEGAARRGPRLGAGALRGARHRRLRPQRLPAPPARASSRSTASTSPSRPCGRSPPRAGRGRRRSARRSSGTRSTPDAPDRRCPDGEVREVTVPDIGDFADVPVIEILVTRATRSRADAPLVTLESDKATMDVPSPVRRQDRRSSRSRSATRSPRGP